MCKGLKDISYLCSAKAPAGRMFVGPSLCFISPFFLVSIYIFYSLGFLSFVVMEDICLHSWV